MIRLASSARALHRYGATPAGFAAAAAARHPGRAAVIDESGSVAFGDLDRRADVLAAALHAHAGIAAGSRVALMARNNRGFVEALVAVTRLGCHPVLLNTECTAPELANALASQLVQAVIHDGEFDGVFSATGFDGPRVLTERSDSDSPPSIERLIARAATAAPLPEAYARPVLMTSGTTGEPRGVSRRTVRPARMALLAVGGVAAVVRMKPRPRFGAGVVAAVPLFGMFGYGGLMTAFALAAPLVIHRTFDALAVLRSIEETRAEVLVAGPTMLRLLLDVREQGDDRVETSSLRAVFVSGAPLPGALALRFMDAFGDVLYNVYASTELGSGTFATPADLRAACGTVGRPLPGVSVKILDERNRPVPRGRVGRIFVASPVAFSGYTDGGHKQVVNGLMDSGDLGHLDAAGRLFVDGRGDEIFIVGGERVLPLRVEESLLGHAAVQDAALTAVPDDELGQRLIALVVPSRRAQADPAELKTHVGASLPQFMIPCEIRLVDELPRTPTGKLRRDRLAQHL